MLEFVFGRFFRTAAEQPGIGLEFKSAGTTESRSKRVEWVVIAPTTQTKGGGGGATV